MIRRPIGLAQGDSRPEPSGHFRKRPSAFEKEPEGGQKQKDAAGGPADPDSERPRGRGGEHEFVFSGRDLHPLEDVITVDLSARPLIGRANRVGRRFR